MIVDDEAWLNPKKVENKPNSSGFVIDEDVYLKHYGVKGMKWGVRNQSKAAGGSGGGSASSKKGSPGDSEDISSKLKALQDAPANVAQAAKNLAKNEADFKSKFTGDYSKSSSKAGSQKDPKELGKVGDKPYKILGMHPDLAKRVAIGAGVAGLIVGAHYYNKKYGKPGLPGEPISENAFKFRTAKSKVEVWGKHNKITPDLWDMDGVSLKAGHTFNRLSRVEESGFRTGTYATINKEDFDRYVTAFRSEMGTKNPYHTTWTINKDAKIASPAESVDMLRQAMQKMSGDRVVDLDEARKVYTRQSGGPWQGPLSENFRDVLKEKGFAGIIDAMDVGVIGDKPIVFFDDSIASSKVAQKMSNIDIKEATSSLKELSNRRT